MSALRTPIALLASLLALALMIGCASSVAPTGSVSGLEQACSDLVNQERTTRGLEALTLANDVLAVARAHSQDMATDDYFSHNSPEGIDPFERAASAGITYTRYAENIAWTSGRSGRTDQQIAQEIVQGWMNSEGHRNNILNASFEEHGLGVAESSNGIYFTQNFIAR